MCSVPSTNRNHFWARLSYLAALRRPDKAQRWLNSVNCLQVSDNCCIFAVLSGGSWLRRGTTNERLEARNGGHTYNSFLFMNPQGG